MMEHGRIVEQGSHDELITTHGAYFRLYQSQFRAPAVDVEEGASAPRPLAPSRPARPPIAM
jgi:ATP-binding cassette subfamily B protein